MRRNRTVQGNQEFPYRYNKPSIILVQIRSDTNHHSPLGQNLSSWQISDLNHMIRGRLLEANHGYSLPVARELETIEFYYSAMGVNPVSSSGTLSALIKLPRLMDSTESWSWLRLFNALVSFPWTGLGASSRTCLPAAVM